MYSFSHREGEKLPLHLTEGDTQMETVAIFTSRADLPADAVNISARSRRPLYLWPLGRPGGGVDF